MSIEDPDEANLSQFHIDTTTAACYKNKFSDDYPFPLTERQECRRTFHGTEPNEKTCQILVDQGIDRHHRCGFRVLFRLLLQVGKRGEDCLCQRGDHFRCGIPEGLPEPGRTAS